MFTSLLKYRLRRKQGVSLVHSLTALVRDRPHRRNGQGEAEYTRQGSGVQQVRGQSGENGTFGVGRGQGAE